MPDALHREEQLAGVLFSEPAELVASMAGATKFRATGLAIILNPRR